jgi:hypothetical protein
MVSTLRQGIREAVPVPAECPGKEAVAGLETMPGPAVGDSRGRILQKVCKRKVFPVLTVRDKVGDLPPRHEVQAGKDVR